VSPVKYELGFYIPLDGILHTHRRGNLKSYKVKFAAISTKDTDVFRANEAHWSI
jgi:hypothetical protein